MFRIKGRGGRIAVATCVILLVLCASAPALLRHLLRSRLQAMIASELNASLQIGQISYSFPYQIDLHDTSLIANGPDGKPLELLRVSHVGMILARSPLHSGPLVIQKISIDDPSIHLIKTRQGLIGWRGLALDPSTNPAPARRMKLSEMFRLVRLGLRNGQVIYEDHTLAGVRPLVWKNLNVGLDTVPQSGSEYGFHFVADDSPLATLDARGQADIDSLLLKLSDCTLALNVDPTRPHSALPPEYQQLLQRVGLHGKFALKTSATLPLADIAAGQFGTTRYDSTLELQDASAKLPRLSDPVRKIDARFRMVKDPSRQSLDFQFVNGSCGNMAVHITGGSVVLDPINLTWTLSGLNGRMNAGHSLLSGINGSVDFAIEGSAPLFSTDIRQFQGTAHLVPHDLSVRTDLLAPPIGDFADATFTLRSGTLSTHSLRAQYNKDIWFVRQADFDLTNLPQRLKISNAGGCITFGSPRSGYPAVIEAALSKANPQGPWFFEKAQGQLDLGQTKNLDYALRVYTTRGRLAFDDGRLGFYDIDASADVTPALIQIEHFNGGTFGGEVRLAGWMKPRQQGQYEVNGQLRGINLRDLVTALSQDPTKPADISGRGNATINLRGFIPTDNRSMLDVLGGNGTAEVRDGNFWQIPVMREIANNANVRTAMTVGEAAGVFDIANRAIHFHPVTVSAPLLGVEGSGDILFDGQIRMNLIATPLGQWGEKLDLGDNGVASRLLDKVQRGINTATETALYNIQVAGTATQPRVTAVPAPFITRQASDFVRFLKSNSQNGQLLDFAQKQPASQGN